MFFVFCFFVSDTVLDAGETGVDKTVFSVIKEVVFDNNDQDFEK